VIVGQSYGAFTATFHGVHKWMAYDRVSGEVVGRGGLSRTPVDEDWGQIYSFLPAEPWVRVDHESHRPFLAHANWLEIGWAPDQLLSGSSGRVSKCGPVLAARAAWNTPIAMATATPSIPAMP